MQPSVAWYLLIVLVQPTFCCRRAVGETPNSANCCDIIAPHLKLCAARSSSSAQHSLSPRGGGGQRRASHLHPLRLPLAELQTSSGRPPAPIVRAALRHLATLEKYRPGGSGGGRARCRRHWLCSAGLDDPQHASVTTLAGYRPSVLLSHRPNQSHLRGSSGSL